MEYGCAWHASLLGRTQTLLAATEGCQTCFTGAPRSATRQNIKSASARSHARLIVSRRRPGERDNTRSHISKSIFTKGTDGCPDERRSNSSIMAAPGLFRLGWSTLLAIRSRARRVQLLPQVQG